MVECKLKWCGDEAIRESISRFGQLGKRKKKEKGKERRKKMEVKSIARWGADMVVKERKTRKRRHLSGGWKKERGRKKEEKSKKMEVKIGHSMGARRWW